MNRKRVQMLRDMIAGIPQKRMNLNAFYKANGNPCGTIACIAGWAAIYPPFVEQGLRAVADSWMPGFKWINYRDTYGTGAAAKFFGVSEYTFDERQPDERGTHKQIALRRLDTLLATGTDSPLAKNV